MYMVEPRGSASTSTPDETSGKSISPASFVGSVTSHDDGTLPGSAGWLHLTRCGNSTPVSCIDTATRKGPKLRITFARKVEGQFVRSANFVAVVGVAQNCGTSL